MNGVYEMIRLAKRRLICGVGINDADYVTMQMADGKRVFCPFYQAWLSMLKRCYSVAYQSRHPSYKGCSVCESWHRFTVFKTWMESQDWVGKHLDKDLLGSGKLYSASTCVFVLPSVNGFLVGTIEGRGGIQVGVRKRKTGKFESCVKVDGKNKYLGQFDSPDEAHRAWRIAKADLAEKLARCQPDKAVADALIDYRDTLLNACS